MNNLESKFRGVLQGPMGSELRKLGINERLSDVSHEAHRKVHEMYRNAGANIFVANTFGATPLRRHEANKLSLQHTPYGKWFGPGYTQMNLRMVELAREVAGKDALVAGSIAPITDTSGMHDRFWRNFPPKQRLGFLKNHQAPQMNALMGAEVDMFLGEAFRYPEEAMAVAQLAEEFGARALAVSFEATPSGIPWRTEGGPQTFQELKERLQDAAPNVTIWVGANCTGLSVLQTILESGDKLDSVHANSLDFNGHQGDYGRYVKMKKANRPIDQAAIRAIERERGTPDSAFGEFATLAFNHGVQVVGGCCGTTPNTTREIRSKWDDFLAMQESGTMSVAL